MMKLIAPLALLLLAACDGNLIGAGDGSGGGGGDGGGGGGGGGGVPTEPVVPAAVAVNLKAITYSAAGGGTLLVTLDGLDATDSTAAFVRTPGLDTNGYQAFVYQETGLQRSHLALVKTNANGNLIATAVSDGGQFGFHFGGNSFARLDTFTRPTVGLFSYTGSYAGVFVPGGSATPALPPTFQPTLPYRVEGDILINASFADNRVNGGITNRVIVNDSGAVLLPLESLNLAPATIDADGRFLGEVQLSGDPPGEDPTEATGAGSYAGLFGGLGATDIAGALVINPIRNESLIWEYGAWNLPRCGTAGEGPLCALQ